MADTTPIQKFLVTIPASTLHNPDITQHIILIIKIAPEIKRFPPPISN